MNNLAASAELELSLKGISALTEMLFYYSNAEGLCLLRRIGAEGVLLHPPENLFQVLIITHMTKIIHLKVSLDLERLQNLSRLRRINAS